MRNKIFVACLLLILTALNIQAQTEELEELSPPNYYDLYPNQNGVWDNDPIIYPEEVFSESIDLKSPQWDKSQLHSGETGVKRGVQSLNCRYKQCDQFR